jgi:hypothetical protein
MADCIRFADFELDLTAYSLRRSGNPVRLEKMPREVLILLANRPGGLVRARYSVRAVGNGCKRPVRCSHQHCSSQDSPRARRRCGQADIYPNGGRKGVSLHRGRRERREWHDRRSPYGCYPTGVVARLSGLHSRPARRGTRGARSNYAQRFVSFSSRSTPTPTFAPAYAGLADSYAQLGYGSYISPEDSFPRARAAAKRALELDSTLPEAHADLGYALMYYDWDFAGAEVDTGRRSI